MIPAFPVGNYRLLQWYGKCKVYPLYETLSPAFDIKDILQKKLFVKSVKFDFYQGGGGGQSNFFQGSLDQYAQVLNYQDHYNLDTAVESYIGGFNSYLKIAGSVITLGNLNYATDGLPLSRTFLDNLNLITDEFLSEIPTVSVNASVNSAVAPPATDSEPFVKFTMEAYVFSGDKRKDVVPFQVIR